MKNSFLKLKNSLCPLVAKPLKTILGYEVLGSLQNKEKLSPLHPKKGTVIFSGIFFRKKYFERKRVPWVSQGWQKQPWGCMWSMGHMLSSPTWTTKEIEIQQMKIRPPKIGCISWISVCFYLKIKMVINPNPCPLRCSCWWHKIKSSLQLFPGCGILSLRRWGWPPHFYHFGNS